MSITIDEANANLQRVADEAPGALAESLTETAARAAERVRSDWPVDSGESQAGWGNDGAAVTNDTDYVSYVHDGLADELVPRALDEEQTALEGDLDRRLRAAGGW